MSQDGPSALITCMYVLIATGVLVEKLSCCVWPFLWHLAVLCFKVVCVGSLPGLSEDTVTLKCCTVSTASSVRFSVDPRQPYIAGMTAGWLRLVQKLVRVYVSEP